MLTKGSLWFRIIATTLVVLKNIDYSSISKKVIAFRESSVPLNWLHYLCYQITKQNINNYKIVSLNHFQKPK